MATDFPILAVLILILRIMCFLKKYTRNIAQIWTPFERYYKLSMDPTTPLRSKPIK